MKYLRVSLYIALFIIAFVGRDVFAHFSHPHRWVLSGTVINTNYSFYLLPGGGTVSVACFASGTVRVRSRFRNCGLSGEEDCPWGIPWGTDRLEAGQYQLTTPPWAPPFNTMDREIQLQLLRNPGMGPTLEHWGEIALGYKGEPRPGDLVSLGGNDEFNSLMFDGESDQGNWRFKRSVRLDLGTRNCDSRLPGQEPPEAESKPRKPPQPVARPWRGDRGRTPGKDGTYSERQTPRKDPYEPPPPSHASHGSLAECRLMCSDSFGYCLGMMDEEGIVVDSPTYHSRLQECVAKKEDCRDNCLKDYHPPTHWGSTPGQEEPPEEDAKPTKPSWDRDKKGRYSQPRGKKKYKDDRTRDRDKKGRYSQPRGKTKYKDDRTRDRDKDGTYSERPAAKKPRKMGLDKQRGL